MFAVGIVTKKSDDSTRFSFIELNDGMIVYKKCDKQLQIQCDCDVNQVVMFVLFIF